MDGAILELVAAALVLGACSRSRPREDQPPVEPPRPPRACTYYTGPLAPEVRDAIERALRDERRAEAEYDALVEAHGAEPPLVNVVHSEHRHAAELEQLLRMHGAPVPESVAPEPRLAPGTAREACARGAASERENVALYDRLLASPLPDDVRCVFTRLRTMSATRHLPAFERCAAR